eukprot:15695718-Heterocapsa_arctica.AAC.1
MPLAVDKSTLGPPRVTAFRSFLVKLTLPTRWSDAPESKIQCPRAAAAVRGSGSNVVSRPSAIFATKSRSGSSSGVHEPAS